MTERILYHSTNRELYPETQKKAVTFREALFWGLAPDGGLFMPDQIPTIEENTLQGLRGKSYPEIAFFILRKFLYHEIDDLVFESLIEETYNFEIPIESIDEHTHLIRLDRGPTASFKDFAAQFMARIMFHLKPDNQEITVLVATSGDTGSAVGEAYRGLEGFRIFILYPEQEISLIQKQQLDAIGSNVQAISIAGKFDDCQKLVKQVFSDQDLKSLNLTSANSINIGRLLPQIVYYFYAFAQVIKQDQQVVFSIPSGNFGNSLGCELARQMGLPVEKLVIGVNENDEFPKFLETGEYEIVVPSRICLSNAMNVGNPSNLARYFDLFGGILSKEGIVQRQPNLEEMKKVLFSTSVSDASTVELILDTYKNSNILVEPHGAVGLVALRRFRKTGNKTDGICLETAHPGKFPDILNDLLQIEIELPDSLKKLNEREKRVEQMENDYDMLKTFLRETR